MKTNLFIHFPVSLDFLDGVLANWFFSKAKLAFVCVEVQADNKTTKILWKLISSLLRGIKTFLEVKLILRKRT